MECAKEKCCDIAKMVERVAEECNVPEKEVKEAVKKWLENYSKNSEKFSD